MPEAGAEGSGLPDPSGARPADRAGRAPAANGPGAWFFRGFTCVWLIYLAYPLASVLSAPARPAAQAGGTAMLAAFAAVYCWVWWRGDRTSHTRAAPALPVLAALAAGVTALAGANGLPMLVFVTAVAAGLPSLRASVALAAAITALLAAALWRFHAGADAAVTLGLTSAVTAFAVLGGRRMGAQGASLRAAEAELARLAVVEERLRIARDVHDLLGHSLSVIALKADLAGRLLDSDPARAAAEIADVQAVARDSLTEVREAVAGYRHLRLGEELSRARAALSAGGIACTVIQAAGALPPEVESVLGWVVREGATNVLRHSRARTCQIQVARRQERVEVRIEDDGRGGDPARRDAGSGVAGLRERVRHAGGALEAGPLAGGGFALAAWVPEAASGPRRDPEERQEAGEEPGAGGQQGTGRRMGAGRQARGGGQQSAASALREGGARPRPAEPAAARQEGKAGPARTAAGRE